MNSAPERAEIMLKNFLKLLLLASVVVLFFHVFPKLTPHFLKNIAVYGYIALSAGSIMQVILIMFMLSIAIGDVRRFGVIIRIFKWALLIGVVVTIIHIIKQHGKDKFYWVQLAVYAIVLAAIWILFRAAGNARYKLSYLSIQQFQTLEALAEVCIRGDTEPQKLAIKPVEVASNVDSYLINFRAKSKWIMRIVLSAMEIYPLLSLHPLLSLMQPHERLEFLKKRFIDEFEFANYPIWYKQLVQAAIRMSKQLCFMGYYSDKRVYESIGYVPFSKRSNVGERVKNFPMNHSQAEQLQVMTKDSPGVDTIEADVVIAGSGAAASILANQLVKLGRKVLLVERGDYEKPKTFNEDEIDMVSRLYADGALQLSRDYRFQLFQGSCVGGSTVVNNAVCFKTPDYILNRWTNEMSIGLDTTKYNASMNAVYDLMHVSHTPVMTIDDYLNPGGTQFFEICKKLGYDIDHLDSVMANINGCLGCGYCNIGCRFGRKLSMLDTILPQTQSEHPGALQILAGCEVISFNKGSNGHIASATGQFKDGRKINIKGNIFISSAGAVSSSILLLKSNLNIKNAGKKLAFNLGTQITAQFANAVNSYDGLQISHFLKTGDTRYVMETWFNPPMFQSTAMPGWFDVHFNNMQQYNHMACTGILVGTQSNAEVSVAGLFKRDINYEPMEEDFISLMDGLQKAAEIYLQGGAARVMPNTFQYYEYKTVQELQQNLRKNVKSSVDISTGSGHPQGGNVMSHDKATGVVDENFKVFGYDNLYVCDASVFPTSLGVNPQVTVMSLAYYAAPIIAKG